MLATLTLAIFVTIAPAVPVYYRLAVSFPARMRTVMPK
jgi:hypothetical protein